jgi:cobalt-zinc-cadmium efflux system outer membrane protein
MGCVARVAILLAVIACLDGSARAQGTAVREWTLEQAVAAALAQHPLVDAARARVEAATGERLAAAALPNPVGTLWLENAGYPGQHLPSTIARETSLYVTFPFEPLFQRAPRVRRADEEVKAAEASLLLARRLVAAQTVRAFFGVALAQVLQEEAEENRSRLEQLVAYNRVRVGEGVTAEGELLRLEVELDRAANEVVLTEVETARSRARLAPYIGPAGAGEGSSEMRAAVPTPGTSPTSALPVVEQVMAEARQRRPEIVASRARASAAASSVDYERSLKMRQLGATFGNKRTGGVNSIVASVGLTIPLFNLNRGGIDRATGERLAAEHETAWIERSVTADVEAAHGAATRLTKQLGALQQTFLARAMHVHELTLAAYQEGGATLLQVLDATRMLADARLTYSRTLFAQRESLFDLALATGAAPDEALDLLTAWSTSPLRAGVQR